VAELPKRYDPNSVEPKWYQRWLENRDFVANPSSSKPAFSIVMPPPNITGMLTLGHVLNNTIQDILARRARMRGSLAARDGSRGNRDADCSREISAANRKQNTA